MQLVKIKSSSTIDTVKLDGEVLTVKFRNGTSYSYKGVPLEVFNKITTADSAGKAFSSLVRGKYETAKEKIPNE